MAQAKPEFGDGDDSSGELEIDFIPRGDVEYHWAKDPDEIRRSFIFDRMASSEIDGKILIENMDLIFRWLTKGEQPKAPKKSHLKVAES